MQNNLNEPTLDAPEHTPKQSIPKEMILWWERRRIYYNIPIVLFSVFLIASFWELPMRGIIGTKRLLMDTFVFIIQANICYTMSWGLGVTGHYLFRMTGLETKARWILFVLGTLFSLLLTDVFFVMEFDVLFAY